MSPLAQPPNSWAVGIHAVEGSPNPAAVQGVEMTAYLPGIPTGLTSTSGPYYMLVLSVIFPNGRFLQLDVRASPSGTDGCFPTACYQSVYNIAKFPGSVSAYSIGSEAADSWFTLAVWRDSSAGKWRYGVARGAPTSLTTERNDFISNLNPNFADADAYSSIAVDQRDEWFGTSYALQEFAALETYDQSSSDWSKIQTLTFGPALGFLQGNGTGTWPSMTAAGAALGCSTAAVCTDGNGVQYLGFIGCCNPAPSFAWIQGQYQGQPRANLFLAGANSSSPSAGAGDVLWAGLPTLAGVAFSPPGIPPGGTTNLTYTITNPNGFPLRLGLRASVRADPGGSLIGGAVTDVPGTNRGPGSTSISLPVKSGSLAQGWYDVDVEVWSGTPGVGPYVVLTGSGWLDKALSVDGSAPVTTASPSGTAGLAGWYRGSVQVVLNASDTVGAVAATWYRLDAANGSPYVRYASPVPVSTDGSHTVTYYSVDVAGNTEAPQTLTFKIDATPPVLKVGSPKDGADLPNGTFTVAWSATDAGAGLTYTTIQLDGGATINVTGADAYTFHGVANGTHTIRITSYDAAGNAGVVTLTVTVGPVLPVTLWIAAGLAIAVTAALVAALLLARRRRPRA